MASAGLGLRERKKAETRRALKAAALDLVSERGYANVTVDDIAEAADVSVRTLFNYFPSKEAAVVGEDPAELLEWGRVLVDMSPDLSSFEAVREVLLARVRTEAVDLGSFWSKRVAVAREQPEVRLAYAKHLTAFEQVLSDALVQRMGGDEGRRLYATLVSASCLAALRCAWTWWGGKGGVGAITRLCERALDVVGEGLAKEPEGRL